MKTAQQEANAFARSRGFGKANQIIIGEEMTVARHISYGYRKNTTDEYVPNAYRQNFGWKNTYYQNAETTIQIPEDVLSAGEAFAKAAIL